MAKQRKLTAWSSHERKSTDSNSKTNLNFQNGVECFKYMWATARPLLAACCKWPSWAGVFSLSQYQHAAHLLLPSVWQAVVAWILTECKPIQIGLHGHEPSSCYSSVVDGLVSRTANCCSLHWKFQPFGFCRFCLYEFMCSRQNIEAGEVLACNLKCSPKLLFLTLVQKSKEFSFL